MRIRDLGELSGPVLIYGGPYSNASATRALLAEADHRVIPVTNRICTGDVIAYGGAPVETVALVRLRGGAVVAGNVERQLGDGAGDCGCGFEDGSACDLLSGAWYAHADAMTNDAMRLWMRSLPDVLRFQHEGRRVAVIHGGVTDVSRFLWPTSPDEAFAEEIAEINRRVGPVDMVLAGHCGIPFDRHIGPVRWVNTGVIGMPPHDGHPATRFAVLDGTDVQIERLVYDIAEAVAMMEAAGLTQGYHTALRSGWWPSEDVLPPGMRVAGRPEPSAGFPVLTAG